MKDVLLLFAAVISFVAFTLVSVTMINTESTELLGWAVWHLLVSLSSAIALRWRYERSKR